MTTTIRLEYTSGPVAWAQPIKPFTADRAKCSELLEDLCTLASQTPPFVLENTGTRYKNGILVTTIQLEQEKPVTSALLGILAYHGIGAEPYMDLREGQIAYVNSDKIHSVSVWYGLDLCYRVYLK